jgi:uncharacterized protein YndB with AHSA1/START domain
MDILAVERSIWLVPAPEQVWPAITEPARLEQWCAVGYEQSLKDLAALLEGQGAPQ